MWTILYNWLTGDMGTPGNYSYQPIHLYSVLGVLAAMAVLVALGLCWRKDQKASRKLLVAVSLFQLGFELLWRLVYLLIKGNSLLCWWPVYPCNLGGILIPLFALLDWKPGKKMFYLFGFVGGCLTFAIPDGIFSSDVFVFPILKSVLQHTGLLIIPVLEYISGRHRPALKDMGWVVLGCVIHIINCEGIDRLLGYTGDYMFFRDTLPFVIPGVPQFITISVFAAVVLTVLSILCDLPRTVKHLRTKARIH